MLARLVKIALFALVVALNRFVRWLVLCTVAFAAIGAANAKLVVDQVYSNANGSIQFIVFRVDGASECSAFSVFSIHDGVLSGSRWSSPPFTGSGRFLVASDGFYNLGIVMPNYLVGNGFLGTGAGVIRFCDGVEFHYTSLPVDGVMALNGLGLPVPNVATNSAGLSGSVTAEQAASAGLAFNVGLTGTWYEPATGGQGFAIEVAEDYLNFGAHVMVGWATYDHSGVGGPEGQRWYSLYGHAGPGEGGFPLPLGIYRNTGGNFNAPPGTAAEKVGSATLSFTTCNQGRLDYVFTDGTGRNGSIPITRLMHNVACYTTGAPPPANVDFALSGNWFNPTTSGQGVTIEINPLSGVAFLTWFTYAPSGAAAGAAGQRWYTGQGTFAAGSRSIQVQLYETTGGVLDDGAIAPRTLAVGSGTLLFESCLSAKLSFNFTAGSSNGMAGVVPLARVSPVPYGGGGCWDY